MTSSGVRCCFCNNSIISNDFDPCDLNIMTNWDKPKRMQRDQTFWCHLECLREKIHPDVRQHLVLHLLLPEDED